MTTTGNAPAARAGRRSGAIGTRSIDSVPEGERHGKVWQQGPFWYLGDFQCFTIAIGFVGPSRGLTLGLSVPAGALGIVFGTFGYRGVVVVIVASLFTFLAFTVVDTILVDGGLHGILGQNPTVVGPAVTVLATLLAATRRRPVGSPRPAS